MGTVLGAAGQKLDDLIVQTDPVSGAHNFHYLYNRVTQRTFIVAGFGRSLLPEIDHRRGKSVRL